MKPIDNSIFASPQAILLMGPPGGGKTTFALQWPNMWIADCDRNLAGPMRYLQSKGIPVTAQRSDIQFDDDGKPVAIEDQWERLIAETKIAIDNKDIQTLFVDSLTHIDRILYAHCCKKQKVVELEFQQWNMFKNLLYRYIVGVRDSGRTIILSCHEQIEYDKKGQIEKFIPTISTNLKNYFAYIFTDAWRCTLEPIGAGQVKSFIYTHPTKVSDLKNSLLLGEKIEANYVAVSAAIKKTKV